jgi:ribosomal protein L37AE/L43A
MGLFFHVSCPCGYENPMVIEGIGFAGVPHAPALCRHCREVVSVRTDTKRLRCPTCRRKPELFDLGDEDAAPVTDGYSCPRCERDSLHLVPAGTWD